ncbi:ABC transporter ATP-binding protein [Spiroplasma endosymbiont of 'Nebria riversi']|uniref:ABC transporter ATP-binding protein n=1 Tax=Spiroplasma endosymbiont of 'Nebria riversi' TaxID=2792084 RepID=UPI001C05775F|nr:ABC transporter ATP-binding protein [Spiroplasma endosymbiont of 'Nebria riversi']
MENNNYAISISGLTKRFKKQVAVNNITIKVKSGKIHGFIGPNGSGKTTTIKCLIGSIIPNSGEIQIDGKDATLSVAKEVLGYIPENARFPMHLSTYKYLTWMRFLRGNDWKKSKKEAKASLEQLNLWKFQRKNPNSFSSGMKKKVLLAQALISNPKILILDEPAANLDPTSRTELFDELIKLRDMGKSILISSHILLELQNIIDEVTILNHGNVIYSDIIQTKKQNLYMFDPLKPELFIKVLKKAGYDVQIMNEKIVVQIKNDQELLNISELALEHKILIKSAQPYTTDLTELYEQIIKNDQQSEIVSSHKNSNKKEGKK